MNKFIYIYIYIFTIEFPSLIISDHPSICRCFALVLASSLDATHPIPSSAIATLLHSPVVLTTPSVNTLPSGGAKDPICLVSRPSKRKRNVMEEKQERGAWGGESSYGVYASSLFNPQQEIHNVHLVPLFSRHTLSFSPLSSPLLLLQTLSLSLLL